MKAISWYLTETKSDSEGDMAADESDETIRFVVVSKGPEETLTCLINILSSLQM